MLCFQFVIWYDGCHAHLFLQIKRVNSEAYKKTFEEIVRNIDKMENECIPSVTLAKQEVKCFSFALSIVTAGFFFFTLKSWIMQLSLKSPPTPFPLQFYFKDVKYMQHQAETLTLYNDGQVPCQFEFIQKPNESTYCKPWLTANPPKGFIAQGLYYIGVTFIVWSHEFVCFKHLHFITNFLYKATSESGHGTYSRWEEFLMLILPIYYPPDLCISCVYLGGCLGIELEVFVNRMTAPDLNSGKDQIEDILVLHLERGKDYFISVSGNYLPSCFGTPIHLLCLMREPIRDIPPETINKLVSVTVETVDSIERHYLEEEYKFKCFFPLCFQLFSGGNINPWEYHTCWKASRHSKRTLDDGWSFISQSNQTGQNICLFLYFFSWLSFLLWFLRFIQSFPF